MKLLRTSCCSTFPGAVNTQLSGRSCANFCHATTLAKSRPSIRRVWPTALPLLLMASSALIRSQSTSANLTGLVDDPQKAVIVDAQVTAINTATDIRSSTKTNSSGQYVLTDLPPGLYRVEVDKLGFKGIIEAGVTLHVQDVLQINFHMAVGSASETVTVSADQNNINTTDATVSTVVDRQFADNLPLNGRSFQSLIELTPGVVVTPSSPTEGGQFSVNGQRTASNYWMVDGVGANIGIGGANFGGNGLGGGLGSFSAFGGTNSLVSVDALQEFRVETSSYAPEFGRVPGGQISILTRSGTNEWHGTLFDYLRNDALDANDWFADFAGLPKAKERQNDFGGTLGGPIIRDKTFFFFSYEGLRLRLPQTVLTTVPDLLARQTAVPAMQPFLNAFPLPNGLDNPATGTAQLNASFSNPASLDAVSLRIDHRLSDKWNLFARYNYSPSEIDQRGSGGALSVVVPTSIVTRTLTAGATAAISPMVSDDFRFNYSRTSGEGSYHLDNFMGAVPLAALPIPSGLNGLFALSIESLTPNNNNSLDDGVAVANLQRQINVVDSLTMQLRSHSPKFGIDFRRLSPSSGFEPYLQSVSFPNVASAETGSPLFFSVVVRSRDVDLLFRNLGLFVQDTWRIVPCLTLTYGLRWDVDFAPSTTSGPELDAVTGFDLQNLSNLALAPAGTSPFGTRFGNVAPRIGVAYQLSKNADWATVVRGGFGIFYDLATTEAGNAYNPASYPFGSEGFTLGGSFPLSPAAATPPPILPPNAANGGTLFAFDPNLHLPYNMQWSATLEQALGQQQSLTISYIGSAGKQLLQNAEFLSPNTNFAQASLTSNTGTSDYDALQAQFVRRLSGGLQALASYTWAHSIDTGSAGSGALPSNNFIPAAINSNRGPSDFDIRNTFSMGLTYDIPAPRINVLTNSILRAWSLENLLQARSAPPADVSDENFQQLTASALKFDVRPDVAPGQPLYLYGPQYPGGKAFNPNAFTDPPVDPTTGLPTRQGSLGRNALRGFGATQWDFAVHRDFPIHESLKLQFRAEMFNVLNHPNFGPPNGQFLSPANGGPAGFGLSTQMLGQSFNSGFGGNVGNGAFDPLYQIGGPRSIQLALKVLF